MLCTSYALAAPHASFDAHQKSKKTLEEENLVGYGESGVPCSSPSSRTRRSCIVGMMGSFPLISLCSASSLASQPDTDYPPKTELIQKLLEKSRLNKAKNEQERLDSYYERNFKDYFEFVEGTIRNKKDLTENDKKILDWLDRSRSKKK